MTQPQFVEAMAIFGLALAGAASFLVLATLLLALLVLPGRVLNRFLPIVATLDAVLARRVAGWFGLDRARRWQRWGQLAGAMILLSAIGTLAPWPAALAALLTGMLGIVAVFRRWSWDEADRADGLAARQKRIPGHEDYNDELLIALSAIFLLGPLLIWRLIGLEVFAGPTGGLTVAYLGYVVAEAVEALPILGNADLFGFAIASGVTPVLPSGGWVAFGLRMALDLMVIGGLIKVVDVARRISRREDLRRQDEAVASGDDARGYRAMEVYGELMLRGTAAAGERLQAIALPASGDPHQPLRRRLQAAFLIETAVADGAPGRQALMSFLVEAYASMIEAPDLVPSQLAPVLYLQAGRANFDLARRLAGREKANALDVAIAQLRNSIANDGLLPLTTSYRPGDAPARAIRPTDRIISLELLGGVLISRSELAHAESAFMLLVEAVRSYEQALDLLPPSVAPQRRASALHGIGEAMVKTAEHVDAPDARTLIERGIERLSEARALINPEGADAGPWIYINTSLADAYHRLAEHSEGEEAMRHAVESERLALHSLALLDAVPQSTGDHWRHRAAIDAEMACASALFEQAARCEAAPAMNRLAAGDAARSAGERGRLASEHYGRAADAAAASELWDDWGKAMRGRAAMLEVAAVQRDGDAEAQAAIRQASDIRRTILGRHDPRRDPRDWAFAAFEMARSLGERARVTDDLSAAREAIDLAQQAERVFDELGLVEQAEKAEGLVPAIFAMLRPPADDDATGGS